MKKEEEEEYKKGLKTILIFSILIVQLSSNTHSQSDLLTIVNPFIISKVGEEYFMEHYYPYRVEYVDSNTIQAQYKYSYEPYIMSDDFNIYYDIGLKNVSKKDNLRTTILLDPQIFMEEEKAIEMALNNGIVLSEGYGTYERIEKRVDPSLEGYGTYITFYPETSRYAWVVISREAESNKWKYYGRVYEIWMDAETGKLLRKEICQPLVERIENTLKYLMYPTILIGLMLSLLFANFLLKKQKGKPLIILMRKSVAYTFLWFFCTAALFLIASGIWAFLIHILGERALICGIVAGPIFIIYKYIILLPYTIASYIFPECCYFKSLFTPYGISLGILRIPISFFIALLIIFIVISIIDIIRKKI